MTSVTRIFQSVAIITFMLLSPMMQAAKTARGIDVSHFTFHSISAAELPTDNPVGNMEEVIRALQYQIKNCNEKEGKSQTVTIATRLLQRQEWCHDVNEKMLTLAKAAQGDFKKFYASIKTEFDWYKSDGWPKKQGIFQKGDFKFTGYYTPAGSSSHLQGSEDNPLTPHVSCATDHRIIPLGMVFIYHYHQSTFWCIAQDLGSAVKGAHVDIYKGKGQQAGAEVKGLFYAGSLFLALPKSQ